MEVMAALSKELLCHVLQFLEEEKYNESLYRLESESGIFCNVNYVEELVTKGEWQELEKYLSGFISLDNRQSTKRFFEIRKHKYLEALDKNNWEKHASRFLKIRPRQTTHSTTLLETRVRFNPDQTHLLVIHETQIAIYEPLQLEYVTQWVPREASSLIRDAAYSCDGKSLFVSIDDGSVSVLIAKHLGMKGCISPKAFIPPTSILWVYPTVIAAHPCERNQFALGLSDGGVCILKPQESATQRALIIC